MNEWVSWSLVTMPRIIRESSAAHRLIRANTPYVGIKKSKHVGETIHSHIFPNYSQQTHTAAILKTPCTGAIPVCEGLWRILISLKQSLLALFATVCLCNMNHSSGNVINNIIP